MGSEMCIRDRASSEETPAGHPKVRFILSGFRLAMHANNSRDSACLLYTSDAADERSSVDLGGRRIIKTKNISIADA